MEPQTLRMGNIVSFMDEEEFLVVDSINRFSANDIHRIEDLRPVELHTDILKRIKFCHINSNDSFEISTSHRRFTATRFNEKCFSVSYEHVPIGVVCSLHGLQNLIYAITGEEIQVDTE
jgi:hypothetical protein